MPRAIRDYNSVRTLLELISTYGFYNREDFDRLGILNKNTYDKALSSLRAVLPDGALAARGKGKRKYHYIKRDYFSNRSLWLTASYFLHSSESDGVFLGLLSCLCACAAPVSQSKLITGLELILTTEKDLSSKVPRQLPRMKELGYVVREGMQYRPAPSPLSGLAPEELVSLYYLISMHACSGYPRVPGEFLRRSVVREFYFRGEQPPKDAFLFRENCCRGIFDEQMVFRLSQACREHRLIRITKNGRDGFECEAAPLAVQLDPRMGRWYLLYVDPKTRQATRTRISRIKSCTELSEHFSASLKEYRQAACESLSYTYLSTSNEPPVRVEARLLMKENSWRLQQFRKEMVIGEIVNQKEGPLYRAFLRDPTELKPLLRSFYPYLQILPGEHRLDTELREELERMLKRYESVP